ncbi:Protoporphyrinogen oxidase [Daedalea quercina L-15889]|uniref:Protoporphyrinogen oxidase n=1 Tax=Daedalea quercina L-15889 TaxID=1314783 RepID=A0A165QWS5_9APHY|nr:Protoporphyrinogen oxidase [Daedalea quercina L-15889]
MPPQHVAILGGGLTGLSSAFHLARRFPYSRISLLEKQSRVGGWVMSERVDVRVPSAQGTQHTAHTLLEAGPRTLRPNGLAVLELIHLLKLTPSLLTVPRTAPAARNRFLHIPGSPGLLRIPASLPSLLVSPLARTLLPAVLNDAFTSANSPHSTAHTTEQSDADESVDAFLTRRFGAVFARTFGSALVHGIYAADSRQLSMRAAFPQLVEYEKTGAGSVARGVLASAFKSNHAGVLTESEYEFGEVKELMEGVSVYSFKEGMSELVSALESELATKENVRIVKGDGVAELARNDDGGGFKIVTESGMTLTASHLVSAVPLPTLDAIVRSSVSTSPSSLPTLPYLSANPASSVTVVNLVFPGPPESLHPPGFGYLIPRPASDYRTKENILGILGTVFDSCALPAQDAGAPATKITVMLGGPYYAHEQRTLPSVDKKRNTQDPEFAHKLLGELARHLGRERETIPEPLLVRVRTHEACIPTPTPGHEARMAVMRRAVKESWGEHAEVIGAGVGGVSVPACVEAGKRVGRGW